MVAGLEEPTSGDILIDGRTATDLEPRDRNIGMVFQNLALFPHKTVGENIAFGLRMKKAAPADIAGRVESVASTMRIAHLLPKLPSQCSGGEAQRVALARTLITDPGAFLLDEPLSNLDAKLRKEMRAEIDTLHSRLASTFVYVTHDQEEAMTLADRIVVMRAGRIEQIGTPMEIYHEPVNRFVATFFGSPAMNLIAGQVERNGGDATFAFCGGRLPLNGRREIPKGPVTLGVRPEGVRVEGGAENHPARVKLVEPLGKETLVYLDYGGEQLLIAIASSGFGAREGDNVAFNLRGARLYLFDASGARLDT
jgi:multiple sugar transport system ATP-binding protein